MVPPPFSCLHITPCPLPPPQSVGTRALSFTFRSLCLPCAPWTFPHCLTSGARVSYWSRVFFRVLTVLVLAPSTSLRASACAACVLRALPVQSPLLLLLWELRSAAWPASGGLPEPAFFVCGECQRPSSSRNRLEHEFEMMAWPLLLLSREFFLWTLLENRPRLERTWSVRGCRISEVNEWGVCFSEIWELCAQWEGDIRLVSQRRS